VLIVVLAWGCSRPPAGGGGAVSKARSLPLAVAGVRVTDLTAPEERPEGYVMPDVAAWADDELSRAASLRLTKDEAAGAPTISVALLYGVVTSDREASRQPLAGALLTAGAQVNLGLTLPGEPPLIFQAERVGEQALTEADTRGFSGTLSRHLEGLVRATLRQLDRKVALYHGEADAVLATLSSDDDALIEYAATLAGERGFSKAVPRLLHLLSSQNPALRLRAIGALGQLKAPEAVKPLADLAGSAEAPREIAGAVQALGDIGTPEARRYLESLRATTPFDDVRALIERVLGGAPEPSH